MTLPELLAPAGSLERLKVAVLYGANAVYLSGHRFGLRSGADNFTDAEIIEGLQFAHQHDAKVFVVLNAFPHDQDLKEMPDYVIWLEQQGVDAVIVSDLGTCTLIHQYTNLPIHLSTQASCLNSWAAQAWKNLGVQRLILGREVSVQEAGWIRRKVGIAVELFIHGSMCMAYSGNCVISNYTAGRDSNRGGCVQSCRFHYDVQETNKEETCKTSFMSSKDLRGLEQLPQFLEQGIDSLKIEGRMKSNLYVATTTRVYAQGLKVCATEPPPLWQSRLQELAQELERIPHRGYTEASLNTPAGKDSIYQGHRNGEQRYEIAGTVLDTSENFLTLLVQNPFTAGESLEFLTFAGDTILLNTSGLLDIQQRPLKRAKPNSLVLLPSIPQIKPLNLARRQAA